MAVPDFCAPFGNFAPDEARFQVQIYPSLNATKKFVPYTSTHLRTLQIYPCYPISGTDIVYPPKLWR